MKFKKFSILSQIETGSGSRILKTGSGAKLSGSATLSLSDEMHLVIALQLYYNYIFHYIKLIFQEQTIRMSRRGGVGATAVFEGRIPKDQITCIDIIHGNIPHRYPL